jgi:DNA-binding protein H-NS
MGLRARKKDRKGPKRVIRTVAKRQSARRASAVGVPGQIRRFVEKLGFSDLEALIQAASERKQKLLTGARASFLSEIRMRAASLGLSLAQVIQPGTAGRAGSSGRKAQDAKPQRRKAGQTSVPVKYRGPNGETWSGRGRPARWLAELEARGHKREEYDVSHP